MQVVFLVPAAIFVFLNPWRFNVLRNVDALPLLAQAFVASVILASRDEMTGDAPGTASGGVASSAETRLSPFAATVVLVITGFSHAFCLFHVFKTFIGYMRMKMTVMKMLEAESEGEVNRLKARMQMHGRSDSVISMSLASAGAESNLTKSTASTFFLGPSSKQGAGINYSASKQRKGKFASKTGGHKGKAGGRNWIAPEQEDASNYDESSEDMKQVEMRRLSVGREEPGQKKSGDRLLIDLIQALIQIAPDPTRSHIDRDRDHGFLQIGGENDQDISPDTSRNTGSMVVASWVNDVVLNNKKNNQSPAASNPMEKSSKSGAIPWKGQHSSRSRNNVEGVHNAAVHSIPSSTVSGGEQRHSRASRQHETSTSRHQMLDRHGGQDGKSEMLIKQRTSQETVVAGFSRNGGRLSPHALHNVTMQFLQTMPDDTRNNLRALLEEASTARASWSMVEDQEEDDKTDLIRNMVRESLLDALFAKDQRVPHHAALEARIEKVMAELLAPGSAREKSIIIYRRDSGTGSGVTQRGTVLESQQDFTRLNMRISHIVGDAGGLEFFDNSRTSSKSGNNSSSVPKKSAGAGGRSSSPTPLAMYGRGSLTSIPRRQSDIVIKPTRSRVSVGNRVGRVNMMTLVGHAKRIATVKEWQRKLRKTIRAGGAANVPDPDIRTGQKNQNSMWTSSVRPWTNDDDVYGKTDPVGGSLVVPGSQSLAISVKSLATDGGRESSVTGSTTTTAGLPVSALSADSGFASATRSQNLNYNKDTSRSQSQGLNKSNISNPPSQVGYNLNLSQELNTEGLRTANKTQNAEAEDPTWSFLTTPTRSRKSHGCRSEDFDAHAVQSQQGAMSRKSQSQTRTRSREVVPSSVSSGRGPTMSAGHYKSRAASHSPAGGRHRARSPDAQMGMMGTPMAISAAEQPAPRAEMSCRVSQFRDPLLAGTGRSIVSGQRNNVDNSRGRSPRPVSGDGGRPLSQTSQRSDKKRDPAALPRLPELAAKGPIQFKHKQARDATTPRAESRSRSKRKKPKKSDRYLAKRNSDVMDEDLVEV